MRGPRGGSRRSDSAGSEKVKDERADELKAARYHSMIIIILITMQHRFIQVLVFYVYQNSAIFLIYCYYVFFLWVLKHRARILSIGQQPPHFLMFETRSKFTSIECELLLFYVDGCMISHWINILKSHHLVVCCFCFECCYIWKFSE